MPHKLIILLLCFFLPLQTFANKEPLNVKKISYYKIKPDIISNLNVNKNENDTKMYTLMLRLTLMTDNINDLEALDHHHNLYRDRIILFINKNRKENLQTRRQKKQFRALLRNIINTTIEEKIHKTNLVKMVLITQMIID